MSLQDRFRDWVLYVLGYRAPDVELSLAAFKVLAAQGRRHWATGQATPMSIGR